MGRWEPNARERLEAAALELFVGRGFEQTTVAEIAGRAGLTERTFFRHFHDKREVLFWGAGALQANLLAAVAAAPDWLAPLDVVAVAIERIAAGLAERPRELVVRRQEVISANPELQERELIKLAGLAGSMADALRARGVGDPAAALSAEAGVAVFRVAFDRWVGDPDPPGLVRLVQESFRELRAVAGG